MLEPLYGERYCYRIKSFQISTTLGVLIWKDTLCNAKPDLVRFSDIKHIVNNIISKIFSVGHSNRMPFIKNTTSYVCRDKVFHLFNVFPKMFEVIISQIIYILVNYFFFSFGRLLELIISERRMNCLVYQPLHQYQYLN